MSKKMKIENKEIKYKEYAYKNGIVNMVDWFEEESVKRKQHGILEIKLRITSQIHYFE